MSKFTEWYANNRDEYNERRRERYKKDGAYRKQAKMFTKQYRQSLKRLTLDVRETLEFPPKPEDIDLNSCLVLGTKDGRHVTLYSTEYFSKFIGYSRSRVIAFLSNGTFQRPTYVDPKAPKGKYWFSDVYVLNMREVLSRLYGQAINPFLFRKEVKEEFKKRGDIKV